MLIREKAQNRDVKKNRNTQINKQSLGAFYRIMFIFHVKEQIVEMNVGIIVISGFKNEGQAMTRIYDLTHLHFRWPETCIGIVDNIFHVLFHTVRFP